MEMSLRDQQTQWRATNSRNNPASEGELLDPERLLGNLAKQKRHRILGAFTAYMNNVPTEIHQLLPSQRFEGLTLVGAVSTLLGQEGLFAQGLWYLRGDDFDWYWARITNVLKIEVREDTRFRGGAKCIWAITPIAEYAMANPHTTYNDQWESALAFFDAPHLDVWPQHGCRPDWWPAESSGMWPGSQRPGEVPRVVAPHEELRRLTELLCVDPTPSGTTWRRLGPTGDNRFPGQPRTNLHQLQPWELTYDGGIKPARDQRGDMKTSREEEPEAAAKGQGRKRRMGNWGGRSTRSRR
ncbi:hypothetical protein FRC11_005324 [Ceratobasidium sp. 423]|nr:hypothetical protein FRC11_005324 [Ceratobasidium sp. 423]